MRKLTTLILLLAMTFTLFAACGDPETTATDAPAERIELQVFAAASMTETMNQAAEQYKAVAPNVELVFTFDSSGTLKTQIEEGAVCDVFISAAQKQMNGLGDAILADSRMDLVENRVVLAVPEGNPADVTAFEDAATDRVSLIALGNADVPVGQYSEELYTHLGLWDAIQPKITFGSNVKEVTTWVKEKTVDCGVVYATDAFSAGLQVIAEAPAEWMSSQVIYPAAVLAKSEQQEAAKAFLNYLKGGECNAIFEAVGFAMCQ